MGLATSRFVRWFDHKYGQAKQTDHWVKCHLMCGVTTNLVTAVEIGDKNAADSLQFVPLFNATRKTFDIKEVSADSAYLELWQHGTSRRRWRHSPHLIQREHHSRTRRPL
jgi:Transposase DDE domain